MDVNRKRQNPGLICTCNDLYKDDILDSLDAGCTESEDVMYDHVTQFRCMMCKPELEEIIIEYNQQINR